MNSAYLIVERGHNAGLRIELKNFPATLGRDPSNSIVIRDTEASRNHIRIKRRGRLFILEDLESRNGTYINGDRVINSTLANGDKILVGATELMFIAPDSSFEIASDIGKFDMHMDEGLKAPIELENPHRHNFRRAIRLDPRKLLGVLRQRPHRAAGRGRCCVMPGGGDDGVIASAFIIRDRLAID